MFKTAEELETKINEYFTQCEPRPWLSKDGEPCENKHGEAIMLPGKPPTITGLALFLGFNTRAALRTYRGKSEFVSAITRAKSRIEEYAESRLYDKDGCRGAMFYLSLNAEGWKEEKDEDTAPVEIVRIVDDV
jgi:hypothetical protein